MMTIPVGQLVASSDDRNSLSLESEVSQSISGPGDVDIACHADEQQRANTHGAFDLSALHLGGTLPFSIDMEYSTCCTKI